MEASCSLPVVVVSFFQLPPLEGVGACWDNRTRVGVSLLSSPWQQHRAEPRLPDPSKMEDSSPQLQNNRNNNEGRCRR